MRIAVALGTRPEIIKCSPLIRELEARRADYFIVHSNQHYSHEMDKVFFDELALPKPKHALGVKSASQAKQTARILEGMEEVFQEEKPDVVFVQGDTNTVLGTALAAYKLGVFIGHVEAGLRSFDRRMPEEANRVMTDHISDYLFAPTEAAKRNLEEEGVGKHELITWRGAFTPKVFVTGNTSVDAAMQNLELAEKILPNYLQSLELEPKGYLLATAHRAENVDEKNTLSAFIESFKQIAEKEGKPLLLPLHPRTRARIEEFGLPLEGIHAIEPPGYLEFLLLEKNASAILTDSGGVQEEACTLGTPCVVLRKSSDRPESINAGAAALGGVEKECILKAFDEIKNASNWGNPYGDGRAAKRIVDEVVKWSLNSQ